MVDQQAGRGRFERRRVVPLIPADDLAPPIIVREPSGGHGAMVFGLVLLALITAGLAGVIGYGYTLHAVNRARVTTLEASLAEARAGVGDSAEMSAARSRIADLEAALAAAHVPPDAEALSSTRSELAALKADMMVLERSQADALAGLSAKLEAADKAREEAVRAMNNAAGRNAALLDELAGPQAPASAPVDTKQLQIELRLLERERDALRRQVDELLARASAVADRPAGEGAEEATRLLRAELDGALAEADELRTQLQEEQRRSEAAPEAAVQAAADAASAAAAAQTEIDELQRRLEASTIGQTALEHELVGQRQSRESLEAELAAARQAQAQAAVDMAAVQSSLQEAQARNAALAEEIAGATERMGSLEAGHAEALRSAEERVARIEAERDAARGEVSEAQARAAEIETQLAALMAERDAAIKASDDAIEAARASAAQERSTMQARIAELESDAARLTEEAGIRDPVDTSTGAAELLALRQELATAQERVKELESERDERSSRQGDGGVVPASVEGALQNARTELSEMRVKLRQSTERVAQIETILLRNGPQPPQPAPR